MAHGAWHMAHGTWLPGPGIAIVRRQPLMARDYTKLRVFHQAHALVLAIYQETRGFPRDEWFGLRLQMRRAAVSIPSNLVEGSARVGDPEYGNFCNIARGSAAELRYLIGLATELGYLKDPAATALSQTSLSVIRQLERLVQTLKPRRRVQSHEP
jgi:four helix bundle protein